MCHSSSTARQKLYDSEVETSRVTGQGDHPICNLCGMPVMPGQRWDKSHFPIPKSFGGKQLGIAHERCNRKHGQQIVTPLKAKSDRTRQKHTGAYRPRQIMPGSRQSGLRKKMNGQVEKRL